MPGALVFVVGTALTAVPTAAVKEGSDPQGVALVARSVDRPGERAVIMGGVERPEVEVLVALGFDVFIEQHEPVCVVAGWSPMMNWVTQAFFSPGHVPPGPVADRCRHVGLLHT